MTLARFTTPKPGQLLRRILDRPDLVTSVRELAPRALAKLIDHVGLEDAGEIVALATTEQLERVWDEDLWRSARPGDDEAFDHERFATWLEILLEAGDEFVADKLAELSEDFVTMAIHHHVLVIDIDELAVEMSERGQDDVDFDLVEKALESSLYQEFEGYRVIARRHEGWDALVTALTALDKNHHALLDRILMRASAMSSKYVEDNGGLYDVLSSDEMLEADVAGEREDRRSREGFVAPSAARSFLELARTVDARTEASASPADPVTRAYFRELERTRVRVPPPPRHDQGESLAALVARLEPEADDAPPKHRLRGRTKGAPTRPTEEALLRRVVQALGAENAAAHERALEELAYLVNVLVAGVPFNGRAFRPSEAALAVVAIGTIGLVALSQARKPGKRQMEDCVAIALREGVVRAFRVGWFLLHEDRSLAEPWPELAGLSFRPLTRR